MKKFRQNTANQNGLALLFAVIILSIVLLIAVFIVNVVVTQLKLAGDINNSVAAIYAADAGVECQLYKIRQSVSLNCYTSGGQITMSNGAAISTTVTGSAPNFTVKSLGSFRDVRRQFEVSF